MANEEEVDVVIVGGGFAGLAAAYFLKKKDDPKNPLINATFELAAGRDPAEIIQEMMMRQRPPLTFRVFEQSPHPGGRALTQADVGADQTDYFDFGAAYIGGTQNYVQLLVKLLEIPTFPTYLATDMQWLYQHADKTLERFPGNDPYKFPGGNNALFRLLELDHLAALVRTNMRAPWKIAAAPQLDQMSIGDWVAKQRALHEAAKVAADQLVAAGELDPKAATELKTATGMSQDSADVLKVAVRAAFSAEPEKISFLFMLYYAAAAGSFSRLVDVTGGQSAAEGTRFTFGTQSLLAALKNEIGNDSIHTEYQVTEIAHGEGGAVVRAKQPRGDKWLTVKCKKVIVAMAPNNAAKLGFNPSLEAKASGPEGQARSIIMGNTFLGSSIKAFLRYKKPFWRDDGLMGYFLSAGDDPTQFPVSWTLDNSWEPPLVQQLSDVPPAPNRCSIMAFIVGNAADYWSAGALKKRNQTLAHRKEAIISHLERVYGPKARTELIDHPDRAAYVDYDWSTSPVGGGPAGVLGPRVLTTTVKYDDESGNPMYLAAGSGLRDRVGCLHWAGTESADEWCGYIDGAIQSGFRAASEVIRKFQAVAPMPVGSPPP